MCENKVKAWLATDNEGQSYGYFKSRDYAEGFVRGLFEADEYIRRFMKFSDFTFEETEVLPVEVRQ